MSDSPATRSGDGAAATAQRDPGQDSDADLVLLQAFGATFFSGPLPHPKILSQYKDVFPECPQRIVELAEVQAEHRRYIERKDLEAGIFTERLGLILAFLVVSIGLVGSILLLYNDKPVTGLVALLSSLAAPAGLFVYSKHRQSRERDTQLEALRRGSERASEEAPH